MYISEYEDQANVGNARRSVYIIVFQTGPHIKEKIERICDSFTGQRYEIPDLPQIPANIQKVQNSIVDARNVYYKTKKSLKQQLTIFDRIPGEAGEDDAKKASSTIYIYKMFLAKEKALYLNLNMMKWQNQCFIGYFWGPNEYENKIRSALQNYQAVRMDGYDNHTIAKPTHFKPNEVSAMFQLVVDTYGIPSYLEANPALISTVTFPFLFGMMFGDMGHGSILLIFALVLVFGNSRLKDSMIKDLLPLRYMLMFMGICATYSGFIYNEFFAMQINIFSSCYDMTKRV